MEGQDDLENSGHMIPMILQNYVQLIKCIQTDYVTPQLIQDGVLSLDMVSEINNAGNRTLLDKNKRLLEIILQRGDGAVVGLIRALRNGSGQHNLVKLLEKSEENRDTCANSHNSTLTECAEQDNISTRLSAEIRDEKLVFVARQLAPHSYQLGLVLGLSVNQLDVIFSDHYGNTERQTIKMLSVWKTKYSRKASWDCLIRALRSLELNKTADDVELLAI
ncbi:uncharacterized protein LOC144356984 [Saccoglossus kowalevskii]